MSTLDEIVFNPSAQMTSSADNLATTTTPTAAWLRLPVEGQQGARLNNPSTLTLALIGVGTLLAYRAIHDRLAATAPTLVRPRTNAKKRRAA